MRVYPRTGDTVKCTECGKSFYRYPSVKDRGVLRCSKKCSNAYIKKLYTGDAKRAAQLREASKSIPVIRTKEHREKLSIKRKQLIKEGGLDYFIKSGADNANWKGGVSPLQNLLRGTPKYAEWRKAVYERDGYKCQHCGSNKDLHAHHIKSFAKHPKLRYRVSNGLTLCQSCHSKVHGRNVPNIGRVHRKKVIPIGALPTPSA